MIRIYMSHGRSATAIDKKKKPGNGFPAEDIFIVLTARQAIYYKPLPLIYNYPPATKPYRN